MSQPQLDSVTRTVAPAPGLSLTSVISLIVGILGFATAIITNSQQLQKIVEDLHYTDTSGVSGEWTGVYREFRVESGQNEIAGERVNLKVTRDELSGTITTSEGSQRDWAVQGRFLVATHPTTHKEGKFINLTYTSTRPDRSQSIGSYVLRYDPVQEIYTGYWSGYDMDLNQIVSFPYILTKEPDVTAKPKYKDTLEKAPIIMHSPKATP